MLLYIFFKTVPPPSRKNAYFSLQLPFYFFMKKQLLKEVVGFWRREQDSVSIAAELYEEFNTGVLLNIYFNILPSLLPWKRSILRHAAILFLYGKVFTERGGLVIRIVRRLL